ncbi:hypothetical protein JOM56_000223 [Amanita muscaria]
MGKAKKALIAFIDAIPESKLTGFPSSAGTIWNTTEFRLDMQGMTTKKEFNLQIQANKDASITSVKRIAPSTVAGPVLIGENEEVTAEEVRKKLHEKILIY